MQVVLTVKSKLGRLLRSTGAAGGRREKEYLTLFLLAFFHITPPLPISFPPPVSRYVAKEINI